MTQWPLLCAVFTFVIACFYINPAVGYGEPDSNGLPNYNTRAFLALANAIRVDPNNYVNKYMANYQHSTSNVYLGMKGKQRKPFFIEDGLVQSSQAHSNDLATNCKTLQTNSCNGQTYQQRVAQYYTCSSSVTEDLMGTFATDPFSAMNQLVCSDWTGASSCCVDGQSCSNARVALISPTYIRAGAGTSPSSNGENFWTVDLGACVTAGETQYPSKIASGAHIVMTSGTTRFLAQYYDTAGAAPLSATLVLNGNSHVLTNDLGTKSMGNWYADVATPSGCQSYYFQFVDSGSTTWRYPTQGFFMTYDGSACTIDYQPQAQSATAPSAPSVSAGTATNISIPVSWTDSNNGGSAITGYTVTWQASGRTASSNANLGAVTSYTISGLTAGTSYSITVTATNVVGTSPASTPVTVITKANTNGGGGGGTNTPCTTASCLPSSYNSRTSTSCATGIMDQGQCGSCYSFSTAASSSDRICLQENVTPVLSPQDILNCGSGSVWNGNPCNGGYPLGAQKLQVSRGLATATTAALSSGCRPYLCSTGTCTSNACTSTCSDASAYSPYKGSSAYSVSGVTNIMLEVYNNGPIVATYSVCQSFYTYFSSSSNIPYAYTTQCSTSSSDYVGGHAVTIVGWGTDPKGVSYWLVANSWNTYWGDKGYFKIQRGVNLCGFEGGVSALMYNSPSGKRMMFTDDEPALSKRDALGNITGAPVTFDPSSGAGADVVNDAAQFILDSYYNPGTNSDGKRSSAESKEQLTDHVVRAAEGGVVTTYSGQTVSAINSATTQPVAGQSVSVELVSSSGDTLSGTVSYNVADGTGALAGSIAASSAASGSSSGLSTGAIIGIAVGGSVGLLLVVALVTAGVVGAGVLIYKLVKSKDDNSYEMEEAAPVEEEGMSKEPRSRHSWRRMHRRGPMFHSITGRSPPVSRVAPEKNNTGPTTPIGV